MRIWLLSQRHFSAMTTSSPLMDQQLILQQKKSLRSRVRRLLRHDFPPAVRQAEDAAIQRHLLEAPWYKTSTSLSAYISCESLREVDTSKIVENILQKNDPGLRKKLYLPRVEDKAGHMRMLHVSTIEDLQANAMNILEPSEVVQDGNPREDVMQANEPLDLVVMPGLAFDHDGKRLGRGGGYYDSFLQSYLSRAKNKGWRRPLLVALAYSVQILEEHIPVAAYDVSVDALVSASGVFPISELALSRCQGQ